MVLVTSVINLITQPTVVPVSMYMFICVCVRSHVSVLFFWTDWTDLMPGVTDRESYFYTVLLGT